MTPKPNALRLLATGLCAASLWCAAPAAAQAPADTRPLRLTVTNPEDLQDHARTLVVPTAYVKLLTEGSSFVAQQSGIFQRGSNAVKASARYTVEGLDKAYARELAKLAYDDFVARLRGAGYTVLTYEDIKGRDHVQAAARDAGVAPWGLPIETAADGRQSFIVAAPSDEQQFKIGFTGAFAEFVQYGKPKFLDATVVIPQYTVVAPQFSGEKGGGFNRISAEIHASPGMSLQAASAAWMGKPKVRVMSGLPGAVIKEPLPVSDKTGELVKAEDTTPVAANALSKGLALLSGSGSISSSSARYTYTVDRPAYIDSVMRGIGAFNADVAKLAGELR